MFTAGAKQKPGQSRIELAEATIGAGQEGAPAARRGRAQRGVRHGHQPGRRGDLRRAAGLRAARSTQLFGSGTVLDSSRLRYLISQYTGVAVQNVHAYIAGEHGDSELPLWGSASIGSVPLLEWPGQGGRGPLTPAGPRGHHPRGRRVGLPDHRGQGRDELRGRAGRLADHRGDPQGRGPGAAGLVAARPTTTASTTCACRCRRSSAPTASGSGSRSRCRTTSSAGLRRSADAVRAVARQFGF